MPAITPTVLGPNSWEIYYSALETATDVFNAIEQVITSTNGGWQLHDTVNTTSKVFKSLNVDGSEKYINLYISGANLFVASGYQWSTTLKTFATTVIHSTSVAYCQRLTIGSGGYVYVFASPRYLFLWTRTSINAWGSSTGQAASGVFETYLPEGFQNIDPTLILTSRENWVNFSLMNTSTENAVFPPLANPFTTNTSNVSYANRITCMASTTTDLGQLPSTLNVDKNYAFTPYVRSMHIPFLGKAFGFKFITRHMGSAMDTIYIKVDSSGFVDEASGTPKLHYIMTTSDSNGIRMAVSA